ncbi:Protein of unknown function [Lactobacillus helveticus CIRM-BIA 101]|uniref:Uncharacterized protein n=1 Tax=Lactobacillus helveticus CIRM-BIA 104 TaxID=1226333 RepID=U6FEP0_LACHE|nr:Protein of unknown function [Lactobacillus helveticus CIRM-BIA 104]CDI62317.1 Protein of unknown function [Lactobacillus helveticus CIRM-BIA 103]CDI64873.1 Protein of unknown function [Lactobacillus helveticus CIRM-BIA 101]BCD37569.1 hypothetical protein LBHL_01260 [Lactobacillus helveticus]GFP07346.1 hypothetical protein LHEJCM1005_16380 [Lactobacillus helveticus]
MFSTVLIIIRTIQRQTQAARRTERARFSQPQNQELERKLKEEQAKNEFLKKLDQLERMCLPDNQNIDKPQ